MGSESPASPPARASGGAGAGTSISTAHVPGAAAILASADNPNNASDVNDIRNTNTKTNGGWNDTSGDGHKEPLLDINNDEEFAPTTTLGLWGIGLVSADAGYIDLFALGTDNQVKAR